MKNTITVIEDGPLHIEGNLKLLKHNGDLIENSNELYLCRCGKSENKPYCDGSHKAENFNDTGLFTKAPPSEKELTPEGELEIKIQQDGPIMFKGEAYILDSQQRHICRKVGALCRCGHTDNSPFCDGTHTDIKFTAE